MTMLRDGTIKLTDGRTLAFAEWGDPDGAPLFLFHGSPGSRLLCPSEQITLDNRVRLIPTDRPGYGNSDPKPGRWLTEWPQDVIELADHLDVDRFAVFGWSGGGPHALACAALIPQRVTAVGVVASNGPTDEMPGLMDDPQRGVVYEGALNDREGTEQAIVAFFDDVDGNDGKRWMENVRQEFPDDPVFANAEWTKNMADHVIEGLRPGGVGRAEDGVAVYGPWGFRLADVGLPVHVFYGGRDALVPQGQSEALVGALPDARPRLWPDGTHACLYPHWGDILQALFGDT